MGLDKAAIEPSTTHSVDGKDGAEILSHNSPVLDATHSTKFETYPCERCGQSFVWRSRLTMHIDSVHEGKKAFSCGKCDKSFSFKSNLKRHIGLVHGVAKKFSCGQCGKIFSQKYTLNVHVVCAHKRFRR